MPGLRRQEEAVIRRLRSTGRGLDPLAARLGLERVLSGARFHPGHLPPQAILCIRRLADPRPRTLRLSLHDMGPPAAWSQALEASVERLATAAARPALGPVPPGAEAVLFADDTELLACLARDLGGGLGGERWWWRALYGGRDLRRILLDAWAEAPEFLPPVLEQLVERRAAAPVLRTLGAATARALTLAVARRHGLLAVVAALSREAPAGIPIASPFLPWAPEAEALPAGREERLLLGLALVLRRAPAVARTVVFAERLADWRAFPTDPAAGPGLEREIGLDLRAEPERQPAPGRWGAAPGRSGRAEPTAAPSTELAPVRRPPSEPLGRPGTPPPGALPGALEPALPTPAPPEADRHTVRDAEHRSPPPPATPAEREAPPRSPAPAEERPGGPRDLPRAPPAQSSRLDASGDAAPWTAPVDTTLGGLFYLANVGLFLGLYPDFTRPLDPGLELSIWDFVTLLGQRLVEDQRPDDPVWALLARLAGRQAGDAPGLGFTPPDLWRVPAAWLPPLADPRPWCWSGAEGRLRLEHPAGFLVVDVPAAGDAIAQAAQELEALGAAGSRLEPGVSPTLADMSPLERWAGWLAGYVRARLLRALALDTPAALAPLLLERSARVMVDATRVEVWLSLAELPLPVRYAGLDRDPGWLPSGGRSLVFRFG